MISQTKYLVVVGKDPKRKVKCTLALDINPYQVLGLRSEGDVTTLLLKIVKRRLSYAVSSLLRKGKTRQEIEETIEKIINDERKDSFQELSE